MKNAVVSDAEMRLYYEDSHRSEFTARVLECREEKNGYAVVLDRTAFFPEGGGQAGDTGWLDGKEVLDTREQGGAILHYMKEPLEVGAEVTGKLDYPQRFSRMQQHTGEHMVSGIIHSLLGFDNVGFHLGADVTTLDLGGELSDEQVREVESRANQAVFANLPVRTLYPSGEELQKMDYRSKIEIEGQVRLVQIEGVDLCACCAPHVSFTGEVGLIKILSCERHRGGCRMTMVCGTRALEDYRQKQRNVEAVSVALSASQDQIGEAVHHLQGQQAELKEHLNRMQARYLQQKLEAVAPGSRNVCIFEEEMDTIALRNFVNAAVERCEGVCGAFLGNDGDGYRYILGSRTIDLRPFCKELNGRFQGRGGGKPEMVQGSLQGTADEIRKKIMEA